MAKSFRFLHSAFVGASIRSATSFPPAASNSLLDAIYKRRPWLSIGEAIGLFGFFGGCIITGLLNQAADSTGWQFLTDLLESKTFTAFLSTTGFVTGIVVAIMAGFVAPFVALRRESRRCLYEPACFWCGQSLVGLVSCDYSIRCPECGEDSPLARRPAKYFRVEVELLPEKFRKDQSPLSIVLYAMARLAEMYDERRRRSRSRRRKDQVGGR